jgi:hypothetical protein
MNEEPPIEVQGLWWLPDDPEHKVPGWLTFSFEDGGELRLSGALRGDSWVEEVLPDGTVERSRTYDSRTEREQSIYPRVHGRSGRTLYNLEDCFRVQKQEHHPAEYVTEKVHVNQFLRGALFEADESAPEFDRCVVQLRHLTTWVAHSGLSSEDLPFPREDGQPFVAMRADLLPSMVTRVKDSEIRLVQSLEQTGDRLHDIGVSQNWSLRVHYPSVQALDRFVEVVSDVQDLVSIASGVTSDIDHFALEHPDLPLTTLSGKPVGKSRAHRMYFKLDDFGGVDGLGRWLTVAQEYRTELGRVMATRYSPDMYLEDRIMNCCAALESFDKVRRETGKQEVHFVERVRQCATYAGEHFATLIAQDADGWAKKVKECRHDLAHHRERLRLNATDAEHVLAEQLFWLFALCMLRLADAPDAAFASIARHGRIRWLTQQANAAAAATSELD